MLVVKELNKSIYFENYDNNSTIDEFFEDAISFISGSRDFCSGSLLLENVNVDEVYSLKNYLRNLAEKAYQTRTNLEIVLRTNVPNFLFLST